MVQRIPCETATARQEPRDKHLTDVLIAYLTWQVRLIRPRPRDVVIWPEVMNSPIYAKYKDAIAAIEREFKTGQDVNARLSKLAHKRAYSGTPPRPNSLPQQAWLKAFWRDKDRTRVTLDVHHLHMGSRDVRGAVGRTGELIFVGVTPDTAVFLTIRDHKSFDDGTISKLMGSHLRATAVGAVLAGPDTTLGGTQGDTFRPIDLSKQLKELDIELTRAGFPNLAQKSIRMEFDDIVVVDLRRDRKNNAFEDAYN